MAGFHQNTQSQETLLSELKKSFGVVMEFNDAFNQCFTAFNYSCSSKAYSMPSSELQDEFNKLTKRNVSSNRFSDSFVNGNINSR